MAMTAVIDYDAGNLMSVEKALTFLGGQPVITRDPEAIMSADRIVLPGVGAFGDAMNRLRQYGLDEVIRQAAALEIPLLGICLGMQLLFEESEESPGVPGLGLLPGKIRKIPPAPGLKIPHMGWNDLGIRRDSRLFQGVPEGSFVYFVHSYYLKAEREEDAAAWTDYGVRIHAAVERDCLFGCQFHPEKSSETGLQILRNFLRIS